MCGIAGFWGEGNRHKLEQMLEATAHRGPDDRGIYINGPVGLGHNRLSIIDLSPLGHQPMFDNQRNAIITFNGEIYNFRELKRELSKSYKFKTKTDTEVILAAYQRWGVDCLKHLNGMFAFVIYDLRRQLLFGARDRLGEKPLKYYHDRGVFGFASEVKGLLPLLKNRPELDRQAISDYLTIQYVPAPKTGLKKIWKLPPGHYFIFQRGRLKVKRYWQLDFGNKLELSEGEWQERLFEALRQSVKERLVADVPLGAFLSGGVDSSAVVATMVGVSSRQVKTFSIGFDDPKFDETRFAQIVAQRYKTDHHVLRVDSDQVLEAIQGLSGFCDEPLADNSIFPTLLLSRLARGQITVALSGDGGDENFAGYDRYNVVYLSQFYQKFPKRMRLVVNQLAQGASRVLTPKLAGQLRTYLATFERPFFDRYLYYSCFFNQAQKRQLLSADFKTGLADTFQFYKQWFDAGLSDLDNALKMDINSYLPEDLLFKVDIASMSVALEVRAPLLDYKLMELTAAMPDKSKIRSFDKKYIFKKMLVEKGLLPREIVYRQKRGFIGPIEKWLKGSLKEYAYDLLRSEKVVKSNIFNTRSLDRYLNDYYSGVGGSSNQLFALVSLASWINRYL